MESDFEKEKNDRLRRQEEDRRNRDKGMYTKCFTHAHIGVLIPLPLAQAEPMFK